MATVRLFAAAAEAAGQDMTITDVPTIGALRDELAQTHGMDFTRVMRQCAFMVAGVRADDATAIGPDATVDVLPPFAGG